MKAKVNRNEFLEMVASSLKPVGESCVKLSASDVRIVYDAMIDKIRDVVTEGKDLSLTGFGSFTLKKHKGHPVQFEASSDSVGDYVVLKFTASDVLMDNIRHGKKKRRAISSS